MDFLFENFGTIIAFLTNIATAYVAYRQGKKKGS